MDDRVKLICAGGLFGLFAISILIRLIINKGIISIIFTIIPVACILIFAAMVWGINKEHKDEDLFD